MTTPTHSSLMRPITFGDITAPNRVFMAPLTRCRAQQPGDIPWQLNVEYYRQRANAGLIITEASQISPQAKGYALTPGIHSLEQVAGWKAVTDAVHEQGGRIFIQLWHVGRISHPDLQPDGAAPVAPSAIRANSQVFTKPGGEMVPTSTPRALETSEMPAIVEQYRAAAINAKDAGFDGVEIHGANGYLLDQFTRDSSNQRTDDFGGSIANRIRLPLEVATAVCQVFGPGRVGYRVSPTGVFNDLHDSTPGETFAALATGLGKLKLAYLHLVEAFGDASRDTESERIFALVSKSFKDAGGSIYIGNGGLTPEQADDRISQRLADAIAFGALYIANPDLASRIQQGGPYNEPNRETFYSGTEIGYTDYPTLATCSHR